MRSRFLLGLAALVIAAAFVALRVYDRKQALPASTPSVQRPYADEASDTTALEREEIGANDARLPESAATASAPRDEHNGDLTGTVVDHAGGPVASASVAAWRDESSFATVDEPRADAEHGRRLLARSVSDAAGRFTLRVPRGIACMLEAARPSFAPARVSHASAGEDVVLRLGPPATLVVRAKRVGGVPVADVEIVLTPVTEGGFTPEIELARARTDANGVARIEGLAPGSVMLDVVPPEDAQLPAKRLELVAGNVREEAIELVPGTTIRGRVVDAATKAPIAGARVSSSLLFRGRVVRTDDRGEFVYPGYPTARASSLHAEAKGYAVLSQQVRAANGEPVRPRADFELVRGAVVAGRVLAARDGEAIAGARVRAFNAVQGAGTFDARSTASAADGRFRLEGLRLDVAHVLAIQAAGHERAFFALPRDAGGNATPELVELGDVVLSRGGSIEGVVLDASRRPVARQALHVAFAPDDALRYAPGAGQIVSSAPHSARTIEIVSDDRGRFACAELPRGRVTVEAVLQGVRDAPSLVVDLGADETKRGLELVVDLGLSIEGRVVDPKGEPVAMVNVSLRSASGQVAQHAPIRTDATGAFACHRLQPGRYRLVVWPENRDGREEAGTLYANQVVGDVEAGTKELLVRLVAGRYVRGVVLNAAGEPVEGAYVAAKNARGDALTAVLTGPQGTFQLLLAPDDDHELEARPPGERASDRSALAPADDPARMARMTGVRGGTQGIVLRLP